MVKKDRDKLRESLNIEQDKDVFIFLDVLIDRKDPQTSIDAFLLNYSGDDSKLMMVVGGGVLLDQLNERYSEHDNIICKGHVDNPLDYVRASDCLISSSLSESFHLSVLEAILIGLPVVVSNIGPHRNFLEMVDNGHLFDLRNSKMAAEKLKLVEENGFKKRMLPYEEQRSLKLSSEDMSLQYQDLYEQIV